MNGKLKNGLGLDELSVDKLVRPGRVGMFLSSQNADRGTIKSELFKNTFSKYSNPIYGLKGSIHTA
jgi:hypothetical protein